MPTSTNEGTISRNSRNCMILLCLRTKSNMSRTRFRNSELCSQETANYRSQKQKANCRSPSRRLVGADGIEPPTYAL
jgi:hypothetical protein